MLVVLRRIGQHGGRYDPWTVKRREIMFCCYFVCSLFCNFSLVLILGRSFIFQLTLCYVSFYVACAFVVCQLKYSLTYLLTCLPLRFLPSNVRGDFPWAGVVSRRRAGRAGVDISVNYGWHTDRQTDSLTDRPPAHSLSGTHIKRICTRSTSKPLPT